MSHRMSSPEEIRHFLFSGKAIFTLHNSTTGKRYTYKLSKPDDKKDDPQSPVWVNLLTGPDNNTAYTYQGTIFSDQPCVIRGTRKSPPNVNMSLPVRGLEWLLRRVYAGAALGDHVEFWHEGKCGRCGRRLTTPESVARGIGPECWERIA